MLERIILRISLDKSRITPTKIKKDVVPRPLKFEPGKIASIKFGKVARIDNIIAPKYVTRCITFFK